MLWSSTITDLPSRLPHPQRANRRRFLHELAVPCLQWVSRAGAELQEATNKTTSLQHQHLRQADDLQLQGGEEEEGGLLWHEALELGVAVGLREAGEQGRG